MPDQPPNPLAGDTPLIHAAPFSSVNSRLALASIGAIFLGLSVVTVGTPGGEGNWAIGAILGAFGLVALLVSLLASSQIWTVQHGEIAIELKNPLRTEQVTLKKYDIDAVRTRFISDDVSDNWNVQVWTTEGRRFQAGPFASKAAADEFRKAIETRVFGYATNPELPFP